jgi:hypothetical protein
MTSFLTEVKGPTQNKTAKSTVPRRCTQPHRVQTWFPASNPAIRGRTCASKARIPWLRCRPTPEPGALGARAERKELEYRSHADYQYFTMLNCDQLFEQLKVWAANQPNSIVDARPTPTPEDTLAEDVIDGYFVLKGLNFPKQSFVQGGRPYGYVRTDDDAYFWVLVDEAFEALMTPWYDRGHAQKDASLVDAMAKQANDVSLSIMSDSPMSPQQFRVIRQQSGRKLYDDSASWEPSRTFTVLVRITSCRTLVPVEEAHFGWKTEAVALYREGEGLSMIDPRTEVVHFIGLESAAIPAFLSAD